MSARVRTHVALPPELLRQIDELVGPRKRSEFIAETLDAAVRRARVLNALQSLVDEAAPVTEADDWDTSPSAGDWVRASRAEESVRERRLRDDDESA